MWLSAQCNVSFSLVSCLKREDILKSVVESALRLTAKDAAGIGMYTKHFDSILQMYQTLHGVKC